MFFSQARSRILLRTTRTVIRTSRTRRWVLPEVGLSRVVVPRRRTFTTFLPDPYLDHALTQVPHGGWTTEAFLASTHNDTTTSHLSRAGQYQVPVDLIQYAMQKYNHALREQLLLNDTHNNTTIEQRLHHAIQTRLQMLEPLHAHWPAAMAWGLQTPLQTQRHVQELLCIVWEYALRKETATNTSPPFLQLAPIYIATELHFLTDVPPFTSTWTFLKHQIEACSWHQDDHDRINNITTLWYLSSTVATSILEGVQSLSTLPQARTSITTIPTPQELLWKTIVQQKSGEPNKK